MIDPEAFIHPMAVVEESEVGARTSVWQFASVTRGVRLGADCSVAPGAMLDGCQFGDRCRIGPSVSMGPGFLVGDDVFIGPSVTFCNDAWPTADKTGFDAEALRRGRCWTVIVGDKAGIGANAVILPGVLIGAGAFVAAGAVCGVSVPPNHLFKRSGEIVAINPAWTKQRMRAA
jgi:acetyltransferase-like isoleucine patch superfamily enzyme